MLKYIKLADDCHSYNIISQISTDDKCIKLSTTQTIPKGKQLLMWFTPEILAAICVPFLTPINIQGMYITQLSEKLFKLRFQIVM